MLGFSVDVLHRGWAIKSDHGVGNVDGILSLEGVAHSHMIEHPNCPAVGGSKEEGQFTDAISIWKNMIQHLVY